MIAIFIVGANDIQIQKMLEHARNYWRGGERFSDERRLLEMAKKKAFDMVLLYDREALSTSATNALNSLGIDIICWKEDASLKTALEKKKEADDMRKKSQEEKENNIREIRKMMSY